MSSKTNIRLRICSQSAGSRSSTPRMIAFSSDGVTRLSTSATTAGPPEVVSPCAGARSVSVRIDRSMSTSMSGDTFSMRAMRNTTSAPNVGSSSLSTRRRVLRLEMGENQRDGLRMLAAQHVAELLRIGVAQTVQTRRFGDLRLDALEDVDAPSAAERLLEDFARELHAAGGDRIGRQHDFEPLGEHCLGGFVAHAVHARDLEARSCSTSSCASFCVICDADSEPSTMHRIATFWVPVSCSSWCERARVIATA